MSNINNQNNSTQHSKPATIISHKKKSKNTQDELPNTEQIDASSNKDENKRKMDRQRLKEYYAKLKEQSELNKQDHHQQQQQNESHQESQTKTETPDSTALTPIPEGNVNGNTTYSTSLENTNGPQEGEIEKEEHQIVKHGRHFQQLLNSYNTLKSHEVESKNNIKSTIYDNYYDLVKINELLKKTQSESSSRMSKLDDLFKELHGNQDLV